MPSPIDLAAMYDLWISTNAPIMALASTDPDADGGRTIQVWKLDIGYLVGWGLYSPVYCPGDKALYQEISKMTLQISKGC